MRFAGLPWIRQHGAGRQIGVRQRAAFGGVGRGVATAETNVEIVAGPAHYFQGQTGGGRVAEIVLAQFGCEQRRPNEYFGDGGVGGVEQLRLIAMRREPFGGLMAPPVQLARGAGIHSPRAPVAAAGRGEPGGNIGPLGVECEHTAQMQQEHLHPRLAPRFTRRAWLLEH